MSTFREIVSMVMDRCKLLGDDSYVEPEHALFIISRLRAYLLTSKYQKMKAQMSPSNLQTITVELKPDDGPCACSNAFTLRSVKKLPNALMLNNYEGITTVTPVGLSVCNTNFNFISAARFPFAGESRWQRNMAYACIAADNYLYLKSADPIIEDLEAVSVTAVFEDAEKAAQEQAESEYDECSNDSPCDVMDMRFPLEEGLVTLLIEHATQAIQDTAAKPKDDKNSSNDELNNLMNYINTLLKDRYRRNQQAVDNE